jgi:diguanylate cyclase (GGDEF)-like protein/PAS domain S-box-containing protein
MQHPLDHQLFEQNQALAAKNGELEQARRDLELAKAELEVRVASRTTELRRTNELLQADIGRRQDAERELLAAQQKYRDIFENATEGIYQSSPQGRFLSANPALARLYGFSSPAELIDHVHDIDRQLYVDPARREEFLQLLNRQGQFTRFETRVWRRDGSVIWVSESCRCVTDSTGQLLYYEGTIYDITDSRAGQEALRESEERYALAMRGANDGLFDWNLKTGQIFYSDRWRQMLGVSSQNSVATPQEWFSRVHPDDLSPLQSAITAHWDGSKPHFQIEHRMRHAEGQWLWMLSRGIAIRHPNGKATRMAGSMTDITQRKEVEQQLLRDAFHDTLTGLPNRALFIDRLDRAVVRCHRRGDWPYAILFMDLDRFKVVNDSLGHQAGDQLLVAFASRLSACLRPGDTIARLGGDEFTILLEDPNAQENAMRLADRILSVLNTPFQLDAADTHAGGQEVFATASIGIAVGNQDYARPQDVLRDADIAMYRAKALGKNRYQLFDSVMHQRAVQLLETETDLRRAVERDEFILHYQPILQIATGKIHAFEALVRWQHPDRGLIPPNDFISIAEETGLITSIGRWVLSQACGQAAAWRTAFPGLDDIGMAVNLSARQFSQPDLIEEIQQALQHHNLPAHCLILEITESVLMDDARQAAGVLRSLKDLGVKIYIDDFGTGYSSLAYLQNFPVDTMKIDRSFVSRLDGSVENSQIVQTIVTLAHTLNMTVTAEGVETEIQLNHLRKMSCENSQGFLLSRPLTAQSATELLGARERRPLRASA